MVLLTYLVIIYRYMHFICAWRVRTTHGMHGFQFGGLLIKLDSANFTECHRLN